MQSTEDFISSKQKCSAWNLIFCKRTSKDLFHDYESCLTQKVIFSAAQRVLQKCPLSLAGCELTINQYVEEPMVKISGVPQDFSEEILKLFFQSRKKSDGENIKDISMLLSLKVAIITFEDAAGNFAFYYRPQQ